MSKEFIGKVIGYQAKQMTYNVYSYYKSRKSDPSSHEYKEDINIVKTVATVTGLSKSTVVRIIRDGNAIKSKEGVVKFDANDKRKHIRKKRINVDERTEGIIRKKVIEFYTVKKQVPSVRQLNALLKAENILYCSNEFLRLLLHNLGFTSSENGFQGRIMERSDLVSLRVSYLEAIKGFRAQDKNIFFLNETKHWQNLKDSSKEVSNISGMPALIAVHASGPSGFSNGKIVLMKMKTKAKYESSDPSNEYFKNYEWVKNIFLPNIAPSSVVALNTPFLAKTGKLPDNNKPSQNATRGAMREWLTKNKIPFKDTDMKQTLYELITSVDAQYMFCFDKILLEKGHEVLHLPPTHTDLNPVLLAWDEIKKNTTTTPKILFTKYSEENWKKYFNKVKDIEEEYYEHDTKFGAVVNNLLSQVKEEDIEDDDLDENYENEEDDDMECESY